MGTTHPRILGLLTSYGWTQQERELGWKLLRGACDGRMVMPEMPTRDREAVERLDELEDRWFPIAGAALAHRCPKIRDEVFLNLSQTDGPEVIITVATLVARIRKLEQGDAQHKEARALLANRGLTDATLAEADTYLQRVEPFGEPQVVDIEELRQSRKGAEDAMWAWYQEWGTIARTAINNRWLLQQLGFVSRPSGGDGAVIDEVDEVDESVDARPDAPVEPS